MLNRHHCASGLEITALWSDTAGGGMLAVHDHFHKRPLFEEESRGRGLSTDQQV